MEVIGVLEGFPSNNLKVLFNEGLKFPGTEQYYNGQRFENMVKESEEVMKMMTEHRKMVQKMKDSYLTNLDTIMGRKSEWNPYSGLHRQELFHKLKS
ncbi:GTPase IMAP family member 7-like isoform X1 [Clarias magur]|uniref:GTPase IMAP family member 7-like isoform X1 n=1 Tax=Clarias magur TaxID=1594786 RepID=A0A8J4U7T8_CLAMG|nr:GTPase IMAP family member 7-like isoform X1 [Clarias magur]